ncbi:hypothetical protein J2W21_001199 [Sinomonas atrocyanea]|uniref:HNH endonuclease signature motif containing protein n=1 Tax=Sinomonas atrocyanea TaxID=37927 RepID=UPI0027873968|nr:HNH endonuclease signature motif containing protein [Sinomonas atrocyanea]MDP9883705.1 hypothetical protein [Sinomonas atrocyanea]
MAWEDSFDCFADDPPVGEPPVPPSWLLALWEDDDRRERATAPGAAAAAQLERADRLVDALKELDAREAQMAAERSRMLAALTVAVGGASSDPVRRADAPGIAASEVAAALKIPQRSAHAQVAEALELTAEPWSGVLDAMEAGRLPHRRAMAIVEAALPVPAERVAAFAARALAHACPEDPDLIPSQGALRRKLRRLVEEYAAEPLAVRKREAAARRRVDLEPAPDGMCWLTAYLPLEAGAAIDTRLEALARSLQAPSESRGISQLRLDVFTDLLTGPADLLTGPGGAPRIPRGSGTTNGAPSCLPNGTRTELIVTVPARTLCGTSDAPGEIIGYGPIDADAARLLAADAASWSRMWVDPVDGMPVALGRRRYKPTLAMRRQLGARDATCRFPGCDVPSAAAEADHTAEWASGGSTDVDNLALLCREHHRLKSLGYWKLRQVGPPVPAQRHRTTAARADRHPPERGADRTAPAHRRSGVLEWTSPTGHRHVSYPEPDPPPPF